MTHRERVLKALDHREPDRVPLELGSTYASTIHVAAYDRLKRALGIDGETTLMRLTAQTALVDEEVLRELDIDTRALMLGAPDRPRDRWEPDGTFTDEWGVSWRRPAGGLYYDLVNSPLAGAPERNAIERHAWPDPHDPGRVRGIRERAARLRAEGFFTVLNFPMGFVHMAQFLRGFEDWFTDLVLLPEHAAALMDRVIEINLAMGAAALAAASDLIDAVFVADDVATQESLMVSPDVYRGLIKPRQKRVFDFIKDHGGARIVYHTCGAVEPLINDFIEIGVDALNPVQVSARGMDTAVLKRRYGDRISFWGGGCDTQTVLPLGSPHEVREEVRRRIADLAPGGGFVFGAVHSIQADVSAENVISLYVAAREHGHYPRRHGGGS